MKRGSFSSPFFFASDACLEPGLEVFPDMEIEERNLADMGIAVSPSLWMESGAIRGK